jgi:hypothetical protein
MKMGRRKKIVTLMLIALTLGGGFYMIEPRLFGGEVYIGRRFFPGGIVLILIGLYVLYADFVAPVIGGKTRKNR